MLQTILHHVPPTWDLTCSNGDPRRNVTLTRDSVEYQGVNALFRETINSVEPLSIVRVQNPHLYGMYQLKKAECTNRNAATRERSLWHATSLDKCENILLTNLDWRRAKRVRFGKGVSFSPSAKYANIECNRATAKRRACILCKVLEGSSAAGNHHTILPPEGCDTTTGRKGIVCVKYADDEFYPEYVVYYDDPHAE